MSSSVDEQMENAIFDSVKSGAFNVIDTAINYRAMKSEKSIGRALVRLAEAGISRDQLFISTKNGYITNDADYASIGLDEYIRKMYVDSEVIHEEDISPSYHVMKPEYIARCIDKSLANLHLESLDLVYIHNSFESWSGHVDKETYFDMLTEVFELHEKYRDAGRIRYYGMATWTCFRVPRSSQQFISMEEVVHAARSAGGENHGFRCIQLPYNLLYNEAATLQNQPVTGENELLTPLDAAKKLGIGLFASVPLMQGKLLEVPLPADPRMFPASPASAKLVQFVRSSPGIVSALIGQKSPQHVQDNSQIARLAPLDAGEFARALKIVGDSRG
jgi:aryl-alcohol dehydrogenase-like predicted oxidoreductase